MTNEAAERLREYAAVGVDGWLRAPLYLIEDALATEYSRGEAEGRRATVERIRAAATGEPMQQPLGTGTISGSGIWLADLMVILDAELSASPETDSQAER